MKYIISIPLILLISASSVFAQGAASWQASAEGLGAGYVATNITEPQLSDIGAYDLATGGGVTYEFIYNVPEVMGPSSAFMGSLGAPDGDSAGLKFDQFSNTGMYGATAFGVADYFTSVAHAVGVDTHVVFVADGTDMGLYVNGALAETIAGASFALSGMTGIGHAYNHGNAGSIDPLDGTLIGVAVYDSALSADAIGANFAAYVPEPNSSSLALVMGIACVAFLRRRTQPQR